MIIFEPIHYDTIYWNMGKKILGDKFNKLFQHFIAKKTIKDIHSDIILKTISSLFIVLTILLLLLMAVVNRPIADDISFLANNNRGHILDSAATIFMSNGRFIQGGVTELLHTLFGNRFASLGAVFMMTVLMVASIILMRQVLKYLIETKRELNTWSILSGFILSLIVIFSSKSLFDSFLWTTSSTVYLTSISSLFLTSSLILSLIFNDQIKGKKKIFYYCLLFLAIIMTVFSCEIGAFQLVALLVFFIVGLLLIKIAKKKDKKFISKALKVATVSLIMAIPMVVILINSPGSVTRRKAEHATITPLLDSLNYALADLGRGELGYMFSIDKILLAAIFGAVLFYLCKNISTKRLVQTTGVFAVIALLVSVELLGIFKTLFGEFGMPALRAYVMIGYFIVVAMAMAFTTLFSILSKHIVGNRNISLMLFAVVVVCGIAAIYRANLPTLTANIIRREYFDAREQYIRHTLANHKENNNILITPVPILLVKSDATDFDYRPLDKQTDWFVRGFRKYYGIPDNVEMKILEKNGYCINDKSNTPYSKGARSCSEIVGDTNSNN